MKLVTKCHQCKNVFPIGKKETTRPMLADLIGEEFSITCPICHHKQKKHVNEVRAESDSKNIITGLIFGICSTIFFWIFYGAIAVVSFLLFSFLCRMNPSKSTN